MNGGKVLKKRNIQRIDIFFSFSTNFETCFVRHNTRLLLVFISKLIEREYLNLYINCKLCALRKINYEKGKYITII